MDKVKQYIFIVNKILKIKFFSHLKLHAYDLLDQAWSKFCGSNLSLIKEFYTYLSKKRASRHTSVNEIYVGLHGNSLCMKLNFKIILKTLKFIMKKKKRLLHMCGRILIHILVIPENFWNLLDFLKFITKSKYKIVFRVCVETLKN